MEKGFRGLLKIDVVRSEKEFTCRAMFEVVWRVETEKNICFEKRLVKVFFSKFDVFLINPYSIPFLLLIQESISCKSENAINCFPSVFPPSSAIRFLFAIQQRRIFFSHGW
jgi:hypothetical protein